MLVSCSSLDGGRLADASLTETTPPLPQLKTNVMKREKKNMRRDDDPPTVGSSAQ